MEGVVRSGRSAAVAPAYSFLTSPGHDLRIRTNLRADAAIGSRSGANRRVSSTDIRRHPERPIRTSSGRRILFQRFASCMTRNSPSALCEWLRGRVLPARRRSAWRHGRGRGRCGLPVQVDPGALQLGPGRVPAPPRRLRAVRRRAELVLSGTQSGTRLRRPTCTPRQRPGDEDPSIAETSRASRRMTSGRHRDREAVDSVVISEHVPASRTTPPRSEELPRQLTGTIDSTTTTTGRNELQSTDVRTSRSPPSTSTSRKPTGSSPTWRAASVSNRSVGISTTSKDSTWSTSRRRSHDRGSSGSG